MAPEGVQKAPGVTFNTITDEIEFEGEGATSLGEFVDSEFVGVASGV